jgi:hypothetical protein
MDDVHMGVWGQRGLLQSKMVTQIALMIIPPQTHDSTYPYVTPWNVCVVQELVALGLSAPFADKAADFSHKTRYKQQLFDCNGVAWCAGASGARRVCTFC